MVWSRCGQKGAASLSRPSIFTVPPQGRPLSIAEAVALEAAISFAYALLILAAIGRPDTIVGQLAEQWISATDGLISLLSGSASELSSTSATRMHDGVVIYQNILAVSLAVAGLSLMTTRPHWATWARSIASQSQPLFSRKGADRAMPAGYRLAILGLAATALLLIQVDVRLGEGGWDLYTPSWTFFRAPVLISLGYWFACKAVALRFLV